LNQYINSKNLFKPRVKKEKELLDVFLKTLSKSTLKKTTNYGIIPVSPGILFPPFVNFIDSSYFSY